MLKKTPSKVAQKYSIFLALLPWAAQTAPKTGEFMFQNVAYRPTVYKTGVGARHGDKRTDKCRSRSTLIVDFSFPSKAQKQWKMQFCLLLLHAFVKVIICPPFTTAHKVILYKPCGEMFLWNTRISLFAGFIGAMLLWERVEKTK